MTWRSRLYLAFSELKFDFVLLWSYHESSMRKPACLSHLSAALRRKPATISAASKTNDRCPYEASRIHSNIQKGTKDVYDFGKIQLKQLVFFLAVLSEQGRFLPRIVNLLAK